LPGDWQASARLRTVALSCDLNPDDGLHRFRLKRFELWCLD
jgi:hypothetical protein